MSTSKVKVTVVERDGEELEWREESSAFRDLIQALGIVAEDKVTISGGELDPSASGHPGVEGSVYFSSNGNIYKKIGINPTEWEVFSGGGGSSQYLKDLLDVDDNLSPEDNNALIFDIDSNQWEAKPICHPQHDYGLITEPVDCGQYDYGFLT
jgi:hypothetical protein